MIAVVHVRAAVLQADYVIDHLRFGLPTILHTATVLGMQVTILSLTTPGEAL
jgi:hypothetical protein